MKEWPSEKNFDELIEATEHYDSGINHLELYAEITACVDNFDDLFFILDGFINLNQRVDHLTVHLAKYLAKNDESDQWFATNLSDIEKKYAALDAKSIRLKLPEALKETFLQENIAAENYQKLAAEWLHRTHHVINRVKEKVALLKSALESHIDTNNDVTVESCLGNTYKGIELIEHLANFRLAIETFWNCACKDNKFIKDCRP